MDPEALGEILQTLLAQGFELPFYLAAVGCNGSFICSEFQPGPEGLICEHVAERLVGEGLAAPVNMMIVDARGEAARVTIGRSGTGPAIVQ